MLLEIQSHVPVYPVYSNTPYGVINNYDSEPDFGSAANTLAIRHSLLTVYIIESVFPNWFIPPR